MPVSRGLEKSNVTTQINLAMRVTLRHKYGMNYTEALNKFTSTPGAAADLARAGKFEAAASLLLKMGVRGDYWRACREAAGLAYDDATNDALMAEIIAAKKARFKK